MAMALVQSKDAAGTNTAVCAFPSNVGAGSALLAIGGPYANGGVPTETFTSAADSFSSSYTAVRGPDNDGAHTKGYARVVFNVAGGACTGTWTNSGAPAGGGSIACWFEISGLNLAVEASTAGSGSTTGGFVTGPSITVGVAALIVAFQFSFATTNSVGNGWSGSVTGLGDGIATKSVAAGTYNCDGFNMTASAGNPWFIVAVAFKEVSAATSDWGGRGGRTNLAQALLAQRADLDRPDRAQRYLRAKRDRWTNPDRARDLLGRTAARRAA